MSNVEKKLKEVGVELPKLSAPPGSFLHAVTTDNKLVYTSGASCDVDGEFMYLGKLGQELTVEEGRKAARQTIINLLAVLKEQVGNLDNIKRIVKLLVFVNCVDGFSEQPEVANAASEFLIQLFGEEGKHARSAIGTNALPLNIPLEIEMIVELK